MALDGDISSQRVYFIPSAAIPTATELDIPASVTRDCCGAYSFKVLADTSDDDEFKNDVTGFLWWYNEMVDTATMKLLKWDGTTYTEEATLSDDTYGTFYELGFFTNDAGENFVGYQLNWRTVLTAFGAGSYKVKISIHAVTGETSDITSSEYCLKAYSANVADKTIKIEYYLNGILGVNEDDLLKRDYGDLNWYSSIRLPGWFGFPKSSYSKDYTQYVNGSRQWVQDEQEQEFSMIIKPVSSAVHELMRTDVMQADEILVTDYNANNPQSFIQKSIQLTGEYMPVWHPLRSKLASVELKFRSAINNLKKNRQ